MRGTRTRFSVEYTLTRRAGLVLAKVEADNAGHDDRHFGKATRLTIAARSTAARKEQVAARMPDE